MALKEGGGGGGGGEVHVIDENIQEHSVSFIELVTQNTTLVLPKIS